MNTRSIAIVITFTALCIALVPLRIPALNWPGMWYYWWEIPIVAAFLLFGFKVALSIAVLNTLVRMVIVPSPNPLLLPLIGFTPLLTMLFGIYLANKLVVSRVSEGKSISEARKVVYVTALGVAVRAMIQPFIGYVNYLTVYPFFLGQSFSEAYIIALMPGVLLFNIIVPHYGVSIGYIVAKTVGKSLKIGTKL